MKRNKTESKNKRVNKKGGRKKSSYALKKAANAKENTIHIHHDERELTPGDLEALAHAVRGLLKNANLICASCGADLSEDTRIDLYDHSHGWDVGLADDQWVSLRCLICGYDTSLNKLKNREIE